MFSPNKKNKKNCFLKQLVNLEKLRKLLNQQETSKHNLPKPTISLFETLERFNKLKIRKVNIEDLQLEVNQIKNEIKQLKTDNNNLQDRLSIHEINKKFENQFVNNQVSPSSEDEKQPKSYQRLVKT